MEIIIAYPTLQLTKAKLHVGMGFKFFGWRFVYYKFDLLEGFGLGCLRAFWIFWPVVGFAYRLIWIILS